MKKLTLIAAISSILFSCKNDTGLYVYNNNALGTKLEIVVANKSITTNWIYRGDITSNSYPIIERIDDKIIWIKSEGIKDTLIVGENGLKHKKLEYIKLE